MLLSEVIRQSGDDSEQDAKSRGWCFKYRIIATNNSDTELVNEFLHVSYHWYTDFGCVGCNLTQRLVNISNDYWIDVETENQLHYQGYNDNHTLCFNNRGNRNKAKNLYF